MLLKVFHESAVGVGELGVVGEGGNSQIGGVGDGHGRSFLIAGYGGQYSIFRGCDRRSPDCMGLWGDRSFSAIDAGIHRSHSPHRIIASSFPFQNLSSSTIRGNDPKCLYFLIKSPSFSAFFRPFPSCQTLTTESY